MLLIFYYIYYISAIIIAITTTITTAATTATTTFNISITSDHYIAMNLNYTYLSSCSVPIISETFSLSDPSQNTAKKNSYQEDYNLPDLVSDNDSDCDSDTDLNCDIEFDPDKNMNQNFNNFSSMENEKLMKLTISVISQSINEKFNLKLSTDKISNILTSLIKFLNLSLHSLIKNLIILEKLLVFLKPVSDLGSIKRIILISFMLGSNNARNNNHHHHASNINNIKFDEWSKITGLSKKLLMIELIKIGRITGDFNNFVNVSDIEIQSLHEFLKIEVNKYVKLL